MIDDYGYLINEKNYTERQRFYLCDFSNTWQKHTTGNINKRVHHPPHLVLYMRTVPWKNFQPVNPSSHDARDTVATE